jgi:hypothetical protein
MNSLANWIRPSPTSSTTITTAATTQVAGIRFPFRNWKDIIQQPYEVTARIPVNKPKTSRVRRTVSRKPASGKKRKKREGRPPVPMLSSVRSKR